MKTTVLVSLTALALWGCSGDDDPTDGSRDAADDEDAAGENDATVDDSGTDTRDGDDDGTSGDAGGRSGPVTLVVDEMTVLAERVCDVDGDGDEDNALAELGPTLGAIFAVALNAGMAAGFDTQPRACVHVPWVDDLAGPTDPDVAVIFFEGLDTDEPVDGSDDFSGEEPFYIPASDLDACGEPVRALSSMALADGAFSGDAELDMPTDELPLPMTRPQSSLTIAAGGLSAELIFCGVVAVGDAGAAPGPVEMGDLTILETLLAGGAAFGQAAVPGLTPDVDLDGDGLERVNLDSDHHVESCVDGDLTAIPGSDCWTDPRMADGFSLSFAMSAVSARFAGRQPGWEALVDGTCDAPPEESIFDAR